MTNLDLTISQACEAAKNKYADAHVNAAHGNAIETLIRNQPPAFEMFPSPDSFEEAADYLKALASAFDEIVRQVAQEANANAPNKIDVPVSLFSDALHDSSLLGDLADAAERLREDAYEQAMESA